MNNPFDSVNLGYDGLFGPRTMFYHLEPRPADPSGLLVEQILVPVLDLGAKSSRWIEMGTVVTVLLGFAWVMGRLWPGLRREFNTDVDRKEGKEKKVQ